MNPDQTAPVGSWFTLFDQGFQSSLATTDVVIGVFEVNNICLVSTFVVY